jgi:hypothetical protein
VAKDDVEMVGAETMQTDINTLRNAFGGEIEMMKIVAADFRRER